MLSVQEINLLRAQNEGLIKQNKELQAQNRELQERLETPKNNYGKIKQMTLEELTSFVTDISCNDCDTCFATKCLGVCNASVREWLLAEVEG